MSLKSLVKDAVAAVSGKPDADAPRLIRPVAEPLVVQRADSKEPVAALKKKDAQLSTLLNENHLATEALLSTPLTLSLAKADVAYLASQLLSSDDLDEIDIQAARSRESIEAELVALRSKRQVLTIARETVRAQLDAAIKVAGADLLKEPLECIRRTGRTILECLLTIQGLNGHQTKLVNDVRAAGFDVALPDVRFPELLANAGRSDSRVAMYADHMIKIGAVDPADPLLIGSGVGHGDAARIRAADVAASAEREAERKREEAHWIKQRVVEEKAAVERGDIFTPEWKRKR